MNKDKKFRILSLDGGGIRGLYSAKILQKMEEEFKIDFYNDFDLIIGTSTGSILAGAIVKKIPLQVVISLYEHEGKKIFKKKFFSRIGLFQSIYKPDYLKERLKDIFKNTTLGQIEKPLIINATDVGNSTPFVFKTQHPKRELVRDKDIALYDAILASSSAPIYFPPHKVGDYLLADGGLWANSPVLVALSEAIYSFDIKPENISIVSIGTGVEKIEYDFNTKAWGFLTGWKKQKFISTILNLQTISNQNLINFLVNENNILRLSYESNATLPLDDVSQNKNLLSKADHHFTYRYEEIKNFINNHIKGI